MSVLSKAIYGLIATSIKLSITFFTELEQKLKIFMETKRTSHNEEFKLMQTLWRTVWRLLKNIKIELSCDLAISLLDIDLISRGNYNSKRYRHPKFNVALFTVSKTWEQPKCPQMNGGGFFFLKEIMPFAATCMDLEIIILELSQTEKDNYHMIQLMWDLFILFTGFSRQDY